MPVNQGFFEIINHFYYKTIYLRQSVIDAVEKIAKDNQTSFNNVVVSMIERCLEEERES